MLSSRTAIVRQAVAEAEKHLIRVGVGFEEPIDVYEIINKMGIVLVFRPLEGKTDAGINSVGWDMRRRMTKEEEEAERIRKLRRDPRDPFALLMPPGEYVITLEVGDKKFTQKALIKKRAGWPVGLPD